MKLSGVLLVFAAALGAVEVEKFVNRDAVLLRFDQDTEKAVSALEGALSEAQAQLDPGKAKLDLLAFVEAAVLDRTEQEKIDLVKRAQSALAQVGIAADSEEAKAINLKVFGDETIPEPVPVAEPAPLLEGPIR